jgi:hypothetical protein
MPLPEVKEPQGCEIELDEDFVKEANDMLNNKGSYKLILESDKPSPDCEMESNEDLLQEIDDMLDNTEFDIGLWEKYLEPDYEIPYMCC